MDVKLNINPPPEHRGSECVLKLPYGENFSLLWNMGLSDGTIFFDHSGHRQSIRNGFSDGGGFVFHLLDSYDLPDEDTIPESVWSTDPREYLRALNWTAVWRLRFPDSSLRVIVQQPMDAGSTFRSLIEPLLDRIDSQGLKRGVIPGILLVTENSATNLITQWIESPHEDPNADHPSFPALRALLQASINTDPKEHHKLSNIAGAHLLRDAVPQVTGMGQKHSSETAMCRFIFSITGSLSRDSEREIVSTQWYAHEKNTACVLLDDMADLWKPFLAGALGLQNISDIHTPNVGTGNDGAALALLEAKMKAWADEPYQRRFLRLGDFSSGIALNAAQRIDFILFLDLRLFDREHKGEEAAFVSKLQHIAALLKTRFASGNEHPVWPLIDDLGTDAGGLNLLPRLLSLFDPTLPIVLFSSTDRKSIVEHFKHYPNIVTDFQKPVFRNALGDVTDYLALCRQRFESAMGRAEGILRTRVTLRRLNSL